MESKLKKLSQLPSLPTVAIRLLKMFSDPEVGISDVVYVLQTDPALSGKILKAANTSQFGLRKPVSDLQRAVVLLGKKSVMALALGFSLAEASMNTGNYASYYSDFWFQSLVRGCTASLLAEKYSQIDSGEAFTLGLLARIGRLAMLNCDPERFVECMKQAEQTGASLDAVEAQSGDITSMQVTLHLFSEWNLPAHCIHAVQTMTISLDEACNKTPTGAIGLADVLRIATAFGEFFSGEGRGLAIAKIYELCCTILREPETAVNDLVDQVREELDDHSDLFSVDMSKVGSPLELLSQAMGQLSQLAANASMARDEVSSASCEMLEENGRLRKRVLELTQSTLTDPLTTLFNRSYLTQQLNERCHRARESQAGIGVLFVDIDHFKKVNDTHGHLVGDEVLKCVAQALKEMVRDADIVTRYGGEEFVILSSAPDVTGLARQAERIRQRIESRPLTCGPSTLSVTASIGGAMIVPPRQSCNFAMQILETADAAMYASKRKGRNCVTIFEEVIAAQAPAMQQA
ncbi:sensor domain-containing diguanylate cyclase [Planctomicrobium piriforme]|uniref:diguanylate cyclase n=1 Tax=Planctomicrobium piriforme TaxID=1576369 RepID=A0A1I3GQU8_9PLAN|nr:GGDEF domain-containing protein [Planctomicrobium piriforme]SFI25868.1 diguanylate cyclase (GGDEF) domain-containing protein [Planctomicrobium piriforme]